MGVCQSKPALGATDAVEKAQERQPTLLGVPAADGKQQPPLDTGEVEEERPLVQFARRASQMDCSKPRLLLVSDNLPLFELLVRAAKESTVVVPVQYSAWSLEQLVEAVRLRAGRPCRQFASVGLLDHGAPGEFCLLKSVGDGWLDLDKIKASSELQDYFRLLASYVEAPQDPTKFRENLAARVDLMNCSVYAGAGQELLDYLEELTQMNWAASTNDTGYGCDWILESDEGLGDVAASYFREDELKRWKFTANPPSEALPATEQPKFDHDLDKKWDAYKVPKWDVDLKRWNEEGGPSLEPLLADVDLVDLLYIIENIKSGRPVPRWQDVPKGARINKSNIHRIQTAVPSFGLAVVVLSYPWLEPQHPDKNLDTMMRLLPFLEAIYKEVTKLHVKGCTIGFMMDYTGLPQKNMSGDDDRTDAMKARFKRALKHINEWYQHPYTNVLVCDTDIPKHLRQYDQRGWCCFEFRASAMIKVGNRIWSLQGYENGGKKNNYFGAMMDASNKVIRPAPMAPDKFSTYLNEGVLSKKIAFTASADHEIVVDQYKQAFVKSFSTFDRLCFTTDAWLDEQMYDLAEALSYARSEGLLPPPGGTAKELHIYRGHSTDAGRTAVVDAIDGTSLVLTFFPPI